MTRKVYIQDGEIIELRFVREGSEKTATGWHEDDIRPRSVTVHFKHDEDWRVFSKPFLKVDVNPSSK